MKKQKRLLFSCILIISTVIFLASLCYAVNDKKPDYEGSGVKKTRPFTADGPFTVYWKATGNFFSIYMYRVGKDLTAVEKMPMVIANQSPAGNGDSWQSEGGKYRMDVNATGDWRIWIVPDE